MCYSLMFWLCPGDQNSTRQTGRVTYDFHSPGSFALAVGRALKENLSKICFISTRGKEVSLQKYSENESVCPIINFKYWYSLAP